MAAVRHPLSPPTIAPRPASSDPTVVIFGPAATKWYGFLSRINLSSTVTTTVARVSLDQFVFAPIHLAFFLSSMAYLEGADPRARLRASYAEAVKKNWIVWPGVQVVNFNYVPLEHRVLVVNVVSLFWNCYLSYVNSQGGKAKKVAVA